MEELSSEQGDGIKSVKEVTGNCLEGINGIKKEKAGFS